jgi:methyltransferase (TIGR00027 family)
MRDDLPSVTAIYVAFARAFATHDAELSRACQDPHAAALLPRALLPLLQSARSGPAAPLVSFALRRLSLGLSDHLAIRTALIDAALAQGATSGIEQVVLLGAGLDARAHRCEALRSATVYEVDHPATQALKRDKARALPTAARALRYVPCDLAKAQPDGALRDAGFDAAQRTLWIWEGVTMYLPAAAVVDSLATIARLSAHESLLLATYLTPELVGGGELLGRLSVKLLGLVAEPIRFAATSERMGELLSSAGFSVLSDALPREAAPHFGIEVTRPSSLLPRERIVAAMKRKTEP